jgi:hypothetical protein
MVVAPVVGEELSDRMNGMDRIGCAARAAFGF